MCSRADDPSQHDIPIESIEVQGLGLVPSIAIADIPRMLPGEEPYTAEELPRLYALVADAAAGDPGELDEPSTASPSAEADVRGEVGT